MSKSKIKSKGKTVSKEKVRKAVISKRFENQFRRGMSGADWVILIDKRLAVINKEKDVNKRYYMLKDLQEESQVKTIGDIGYSNWIKVKKASKKESDAIWKETGSFPLRPLPPITKQFRSGMNKTEYYKLLKLRKDHINRISDKQERIFAINRLYMDADILLKIEGKKQRVDNRHLKEWVENLHRAMEREEKAKIPEKPVTLTNREYRDELSYKFYIKPSVDNWSDKELKETLIEAHRRIKGDSESDPSFIEVVNKTSKKETFDVLSKIKSDI